VTIGRLGEFNKHNTKNYSFAQTFYLAKHAMNAIRQTINNQNFFSRFRGFCKLTAKKTVDIPYISLPWKFYIKLFGNASKQNFYQLIFNGY
jgi:hypothetical protein